MSLYILSKSLKAKFVFVDAPVLTESEEREVKTNFDQVLLKNPKAFDTSKFATKEILVSDGEIIIEVCKTSYSKYLWSRGTKRNIVGLQPISCDTLFCDGEFVYLLNKAGNTMYTSNKVDTVGGTLEFKENTNFEHFYENIIEHTMEEIEEEAEYFGDKITESDLIPLIGCYNTKLNKLDIMHLVNRKLVKPKNWEGTDVVSIPLNSFDKWVTANQERIPDILKEYFKKLDQSLILKTLRSI